MKNSGVFTLSLDCEGLWGMADQPLVLSSGHINSSSLGSAYQNIANDLEQCGIRATAAFVSAFAAPTEVLQECLPLVEQIAEMHPNWFKYVLPKLRQGDDQQLDGWKGHDFWRCLANAGHEMGWHGATHMPLNDLTAPEALDLELLLASKLFDAMGHTPTSIVFPRNQLGHPERFRKAGFNTYRASAGSGCFSRALGLLREWHVYDSTGSDKPLIKDEMCVSPCGFFLNWPSGVRSSVPVAVTIQRWRSLLCHAAENGGYVHMWFHPHNLITAPTMRTTFSEIMREVGKLVRTGDLLNLTMAEANVYYGLTKQK